MQSLQEVFNRIQAAKGKQREIKRMYKDALEGSAAYQQNVEEMNRLREETNKIEATIKEDFRNEMESLDELKLNLESDSQMISDIALSQIVKGEKAEVIDQSENGYTPLFSVKFKKSNNINR
jgi:hypothetical protein